MKTISWRREPKGPGNAWHMFIDAGGERVELLAYDSPATLLTGRICGFEIYGRLRPSGPFHEQLAAGEAESLEEAKAAAQRMANLPREAWAVLPRSWSG